MDIWMTWCQKTAKCKHCEKPIEVGDPMVRGKFWRKHGQLTKWSFPFYWHVQCWVDQGMEQLRRHPRISRYKGGVSSWAKYGVRELSDEDKATRISLLQKRANIVQRMRKAAIEGNLDLLIDLQSRLDGLIPEIEKVGGVPKSWMRYKDSGGEE